MEAWRVAEMVNALPREVHDPTLPSLAQQACLDSFFVNVRALIEFLEIKPAAKDFAASTVLPGWKPRVDAAEKQRLIDVWAVASHQLVHFGSHRVKHDDGTSMPVDVSLEALDRIADDVLTVWDQYATKLDNSWSPRRADFSLHTVTAG